MLKFVFLLFLMPSFSSANDFGGNSLGGKFASQVNTSAARVDDETAPFTNPAGIAKLNVDSLSSGASSYSALKAQKDNENQISTSSSTSHVAYIQSLSNYNIGWLAYTLASEFNQKTESKRYKNSEGYDSYSYTASRDQQEVNMYILGIAPKKANWGIAFNIYDINYEFQTSRGQHSYFKTDYIKRTWSNSYMSTHFKVKLISLSIGLQKRYNNFAFGIKAESPAYIISNDSHQTVDMMYVTPYLQNDSYILANNVDTDLEIKDNTFIPENFTLGVAYLTKNYEFEFNLYIKSAAKNHHLLPEKEMISYTWFTQTDTYNTQSPESSEDSSDYSKAIVLPSVGVQFSSTKDEQYGLGLSYAKNNNKDDTGVNTVTLATGYAKRFKNFLGTYALVYKKDFDTGQNVVYDYEKEEDVKTDLSKDSLSLVFGGSYFF